MIDKNGMSEHSQSTPEVSPCHSPLHSPTTLPVNPSGAPDTPPLHLGDAPGSPPLHLGNAPGTPPLHPGDAPGSPPLHLGDAPGTPPLHLGDDVDAPCHTPSGSSTPGDEGHAHNLQQDLDLPDPGEELGDPISEDEFRDELIENDQEEGELSEEVLSDISDGALEESGELEDGEVSGASSTTASPGKFRSSRNGHHRYSMGHRNGFRTGTRGHGDASRRTVFRSPSRTESEFTLSESEDESRGVFGRQDFITDSPASPEAVPGDEIAIEPRIIPVGDLGEDGEELDDDIDEDILYLRLIALRSMQQEEEENGKVKDDGKIGGNCSGADLYKDVSDDLTNEMQELLEEAEEAAAASSRSPEKVAAAHEVITIEDDDDDQLSKMKIQLNESFMTLKRQSSKVLTKQWSPSYSPTQSPEVYSPGSSPKYIPGALYSPIIEEIDLSSPPPSPPHSPLPPLPDHPPLPSRPPLPTYHYSPNKPPAPPPPVLLLPPPPPPVAVPRPPPQYFPRMPQLPLPVFASGEPLPPGEDCVPDKDVPRLGPPPRGPQEPQDMDLDSGNEAESKFFKDQRRQMMNYPQADLTDDLFPSSVWGFGRNTFHDRDERRRYRGDFESQDAYYFGRGGAEKRGPKPDTKTLRRERNRRRNERKRKYSQRSGDLYEEGRTEKRKRKLTERDKVNKIVHKISADNEVKELDEDEEELRALLLKQVGSKKKESATNDEPATAKPIADNAEVENNNKENEINNDVDISKESEVDAEKEKDKSEMIVSPVAKIENSITTVSSSSSCLPTAPQNSKSLPLPPFALAKSTSLPAFKKITSTLPTSKKLKVVKAKSDSLGIVKRLKSGVRRAKAGAIKRLSSMDKQRSFPNLHKKIVVPLHADSDSEDEEQSHEKNQNGAPVKTFGLNLDAFLKEARKTSVVPLHKTGFKSNILTNGPFLRSLTIKRKIPAGLKLNIKAAQRLTPAAKQTLMSSNVSHLTKDKQKEYLHLKELIAKKELLKKSKKAVQQKVTAVKSNQKTAIEKPKEESTEKITWSSIVEAPSNDALKNGDIEDDEDENALRLELLETMKKTLQKKAEAMDAQKKDKTESVPNGAADTTDDTRIKNNETTKPPEDPRCVPGNNRTVLMSNKLEPSSDGVSKSSSDVVSKPSSDVVSKSSSDVVSKSSSDLVSKPHRSSPHKAGSPHKNRSPGKGDPRDFSKSFSQDFTVKISGETRNVESKREDRSSRQRDDRTRQVISRRKSSSERSKTSTERSKWKPLPPEEKLPLLAGVSELEAVRLNSTEENVIGLRKTMESSLYKLSAYMSQLKNENIGVESVQEYQQKLRKQMAEAENLLAKRQNKVENLRDVIRKSREEVTSCRQNLIAKEDECKGLGKIVHGPKYNTPSVGADNISRKLAQIASTAQKVKTHSEELDEGGKEGVEEVADAKGKDIDMRPGLIGVEFSSPLAHLKANPGANLDPHLELCRFELAGKCSDDSCTYQHHLK